MHQGVSFYAKEVFFYGGVYAVFVFKVLVFHFNLTFFCVTGRICKTLPPVVH